MLTQEHAQALVHATAYDATGGKLGKIGQVYLDNLTQAPEWVTVHTGLFGTKESFVPVRDADLDGDRLRLPFEKHVVKNAPDLDPEGPRGTLSPEQEQELYRHYGMRPSAPPVVSDAIDEDTGRFSSFGPATALDGLADDTPHGEQAPPRPARPDLPPDDPFAEPYGPFDDDPPASRWGMQPEPREPSGSAPHAEPRPFGTPPPEPSRFSAPPEPSEVHQSPTLSSFRPPTAAAHRAATPAEPMPDAPGPDATGPDATDAAKAPEPGANSTGNGRAPNVFARRSADASPFPPVTTSPLVPLTPAAPAERGPADHVGRHRRPR